MASLSMKVRSRCWAWASASIFLSLGDEVRKLTGFMSTAVIIQKMIAKYVSISLNMLHHSLRLDREHKAHRLLIGACDGADGYFTCAQRRSGFCCVRVLRGDTAAQHASR